MYAFSQLEAARVHFDSYFGRSVDGRLTIICSMDMTDYTDKTGNQWWVYSRVDGNDIVFQPIDVLYQRKLMDIAGRRGYHEWAIGKLSGGRAPNWFEQGLASLMSDEDEVLKEQILEYAKDGVVFKLGDIESALEDPKDRKAYRLARYAAWRMVRRLTSIHGQEKIVGVVGRMGEGQKYKRAFETTFGQSYDQLIAYALDFKVGE
jgi:hypothetical protein